MRTGASVYSVSSHHEAIFRYKYLLVVIFRIKRTTTRAFTEAAASQACRSKITAIFAKTSCAHDQNEPAACEGAAVDAFENEAHILVDNTMATFKVHRFHFDPFLLSKTELFSSPFTLLSFQTETDIYQLVFTLFLKNASVFLFLTMRPSRLLILAFSNCSVLVFTLQSCVFV